MKDLETLMPAHQFIRINQGEIVNLDHVVRLDLSATSTVGLTLSDSTRCFVSRRSLPAFRRALDLTS